MNHPQKINRRLGVNVDHIATLREARKVSYPSPLDSLSILKSCQVDQVTIHLREDRRHIQDADFHAILNAKILPVNLEMAVTDEMVLIACHNKPHTVTFVPEKREEITTEGASDCITLFKKLKSAIEKVKSRGIRCSLFIDPDVAQVEMAKELGADAIEIHTGTYCHVIEKFFEKSKSYDYTTDSHINESVKSELNKIKVATDKAVQAGLKVFAGHGLHTHNLVPITKITEIEGYNIGHAIIARSVFVGLEKAIFEIKNILQK